jgi:predicted TPR repeat methyltransferase
MDEQLQAAVAEYDGDAEATGWHGPEVAFGLAFKYVRAGESILDLGIGTGLASELFRKAGLKVCGMDLDPDMLAACRAKGFTALTLHDLTEVPYPFGSQSFDHAVCVGVLDCFPDLSPVFAETARVLRRGGVFAFVVGDRSEDEAPEFVVGAEYTWEGEPATIYRHSPCQIHGWLDASGFTLLRDLAFSVPMNRERTYCLPARGYLAGRDEGALPLR